MAKLTKHQRARIITAFPETERTQAFLLRDDVRVCLTKQAATTTLDYANPAGDPVLVVITNGNRVDQIVRCGDDVLPLGATNRESG